MAGRPPLPIGVNGAIRRVDRGGGVWMAVTWYRDVDGKSRRVTATVKGPKGAAAELALKEKLKARSVLGGDVDLGPESTVAELAAAWVPSMDQGQATQDKYRWYLDKHILPALGEYRLREATTARLDGFLRRIESQGATAPKMCRIVLSLMFGMAARYDAVATNPVRDTRKVKAAEGKKNERVMTVPEVHRFRRDIAEWIASQPKQATARARLVDAVEIYIATGLRPMELLALLRTDIDFKARTLTVTGTVKRDSVNGLHRQPFPKSKKARELVLPEFALTVLRRRVMESPTALVFPNRDGAVIEPANWRRTMREFREWADSRGRDWSWVEHRGFRAAVATLIDSEAGSVVASKQLGHSSDAITRRHYIKQTGLAPDSSAVLERFN